MKKTIIALLALAGVASAETTLASYVGTFEWKADTAPSFTFTDTGSPLTMSIDLVTKTVNNDAVSSYVWDSAGVDVDRSSNVTYFSDKFTPDLNMDTGKSWTVQFTLTNGSSQDITINRLLLDSFIYTGTGAQHKDDNVVRQAVFTLSDGIEGKSEVTFTESGVYKTDEDALIAFAAPVTIAASDTLTFELTVGKGTLTNQGSFVGLKGATFSYVVPEPTTATLSLLALAGLAMRRRRK